MGNKINRQLKPTSGWQEYNAKYSTMVINNTYIITSNISTPHNNFPRFLSYSDIISSTNAKSAIPNQQFAYHLMLASGKAAMC